MKTLVIILVVLTTFSWSIDAKMQDFMIEIDDILNESLMPMSLVVLENSKDDSSFMNISTRSINEDEVNLNQTGEQFGSFDKALSSMGFHRRMLNDYLCSKFVVSQIVDELKPLKMQNRLGVAKTSSNGSLNSAENIYEKKRKPNILFDEGSVEYKNWLAKTTTLKDIFRNMQQNKVERDPSENQRNDQYMVEEDSEYRELFEEGDVTGFMSHKPLPSSSETNHYNSNIQAGAKQGNASRKTAVIPSLPNSVKNKKFLHTEDYQLHSPIPVNEEDSIGLSDGYNYPTGGSSYASSGYTVNSHPPVYGPPAIAPATKKLITIKDLFDIALTTLAFLSFGMFVIQVIMCISMAKGAGDNMMMPMEMIPASAMGGDEVETTEMEVRRKRSADNTTTFKRDRQKEATLKKIDEISRGALRAIDSFILVNHDEGNCLKRTICENNKFSRSVDDLQKFTIPLFGISLSYVSSHVNNLPMISNLANLHASLIGLGNGDCRIFSCDTEKIKKLKKK